MPLEVLEVVMWVAITASSRQAIATPRISNLHHTHVIIVIAYG